MEEMRKKERAALSVKLKKLRAEYNLTQTDIAIKLGMSQQRYSKLENCESSMDSKTLKQICEVYGVSADYLLDIDSTPATTPTVTATACGYVTHDDLESIIAKVVSAVNKKD